MEELAETTEGTDCRTGAKEEDATANEEERGKEVEARTEETEAESGDETEEILEEKSRGGGRPAALKRRS